MTKARDLANLGNKTSLDEINDAYDAGALSNRNLIINGDMKIAQRATAATQAGNGTFDTVDRIMTWSVSGGGTFTGSQSTGHQLATGHDTAYKVDVTGTDTSLASGDYYEFLHRIEARNLQHLRWGTASAKKLQVSFWVRATKTGVQSLFFSKQGTGQDYRNVINYTINTTDTWEYKTIEVPALTASTIANDDTTYLQVGFVLAMGSGFNHASVGNWTTAASYPTSNTVNHMDSTSNDFYLTGLQLEVGNIATPYEHRSYGDELAKCQRYYYSNINTSNNRLQFDTYVTSGIYPGINLTHPTTMRANPTIAKVGSWTGSNIDQSTLSLNANVTSVTLQADATGTGRGYLYPNVNGGFSCDAEL
jgi:hypothetical protein